MSFERTRDDSPDPNYAAARDFHAQRALLLIGDVKVQLDSALRGHQHMVPRTALSTAYDLLNQASGLVRLALNGYDPAEDDGT